VKDERLCKVVVDAQKVGSTSWGGVLAELKVNDVDGRRGHCHPAKIREGVGRLASVDTQNRPLMDT
jgi:hypothetical protein